VLLIKNKKNPRENKKGSSIVELIIVTVLFAVLIPSSLGIFVSARKIIGQSYIQHQAAVNLGESNDILRYLRNLSFDLISDGNFYLIRNPGTNSWLIKNDLPDKDVYERYITVENALRHDDTDDLYFDGDTGTYYEDTNTKKVTISILWAPDYIHLDLITQTIYISNWHKIITYE
jgi:hypothetical protein